jgi:hypothetical protein
MMRIRVIIKALTIVVAIAAGHPVLRAESAGGGPDFKEVFELVREHLAGAQDVELNRAAVEGFVAKLSPKVVLLPKAATGDAAAETTGPVLARTTAFEDGIGYIRVGRVAAGLADGVRDAWRQFSTNKLKGLVLDLRFADGEDYAAAAGVSDLFVGRERPLLDWGSGPLKSSAKSDYINAPVAVLVNRQTARAAEGLAGVLRETAVGLIIGGKTAGQAFGTREFALKNGERLRIASTPVRLGDGAPLPMDGLNPDIVVTVSLADERAYLADPYKVLGPPGGLAGGGSGGNTNLAARRPRFNEAELVRERREGITMDSEFAGARRGEPEKPQVRDPALARAMDLLKGLAVVRQARS